MTEWVIDVEQSLVDALSESIHQGPVIDIVDGEGRRLLVEDTVARIDGVKVEIFSDEHPPPHFRVKYQNSTANFKISDCSRINGSDRILKFEKNIILWWQENKQKLIDIWNRRRPSDCPVGEYSE